MTTEILIIGKKEYTVEVRDINQADLVFYIENPRVYSVLNNMGIDPSQEEIEEYMCGLEHVKQLRVSIESNGGLIDPLIVRDGDFTVLEGNSRLAAYRLLCKQDPVRWGRVRCKILPADIGEEVIFSLLGQYHIIGRKDWDPYEQAHYLYRRSVQTKIPIQYMAQELGIPTQRAEKMIQVIKFMIDHQDLNKRHWSYYEEYFKNSSLKKYRQLNPDMDDIIAEAVMKDAILEAADMRKLGQVAAVDDKQSKKIMRQISSGEIDLYEGYEIIEEAGKLRDALKKLHTFRIAISEQSFERRILSSNVQKAKFEIGKIIKRLAAIEKLLE